jgi:hypothetical protein
MRVSDQFFRRARNDHESTEPKFSQVRESSLGGVKKKAPPKRARLFRLMPGSDLLSHGKPHTTIGDASFHC